MFSSHSIWTVATLCLLTFGASRASADTVFSATFDDSLAAEGSGGYRLATKGEFPFAKGRLGSAVRLDLGKGPLLYEGGTVALAEKGCLSFWLGSVGLRGFDRIAVNFLTLRQGALTIQLFKNADGYLHAVETRGSAVTVYRYPLYDLLPAYPTTAEPGSADVRHFVFYQWGGQDSGLYLNGIAGEKMAATAALPTAVRDGQILIGDANAGLLFDEAVVANSTKSAREVNDNFVSYLSGSYSLPLPQITVTERRAPIIIDGDLGDDAWKDASMLSGIHDLQTRQLLPYDATFYFTYDQDKFYLGMKTYADYPLVTSAGNRDKEGENFGVCMQDCMEILLMPYESIRYDYYHFLGNSSGYFVDQLGTNPNWDGRWEYKCQVKNGVWTAELAIPYDSLRNDSEKALYPKGDGMWRFNVTRNWDGVLPNHWAALCYCGTYGDFGKFGLMSFEKEGVSPRFLGLTPGSDSVSIGFELANNGNRTRKLSAAAFGYAKVLPFAEAREKLDLKGGERQTLTLTLPLTGVKEGALEWSITDAETGKFLYRGSGRYPLAQGRAEAYKKELADQERLRRELEANGTQPEAAKKEEAKTEPKPDAILWPTPDAVDGALTKRLQWKNNTLGYSKQVPPPWIPVSERDGKIGVWGRTYDIAGSLILGGVSVQGRELLAGPVALVLERGGKQTRYEKAAASVTGKDDTRVDFVAVGGDRRLTISTRSYIEYDGCMWVEMKLLPHEKIAFERMWIEIPYQADQAPDFNYWIDKESGSRCGTIPATGIAETYRPYVWLGRAAGGLAWFNEEYREWYVDEPEKARVTLIEPGTGRTPTRLKIMLALAPTTLDRMMTVEFGFMATPVKPLPKNWRLYDHYCGWSKLKGQFAEWGTGYFIKEPDDPADFTQRLAQFDKANPYTIATPNCGSNFFTETNYKDGRAYPDYWLWGYEFAQGYNPSTKVSRQLWRTPDSKEYQVGYTTAIPSREYADWYLYNYHRLMADYPLLKGVYMDTCIPAGNNRLNGTGFVDRYGRQRGTVQIMNSRQFTKRLYTMFWQMRGDPDEHPWVIYVHCSNQICPPIHAFANSFLQGEGLSVGPRAFGDHPLNALPMDAMRVGFNGHAYGWIEQFLGLYTDNMETFGELTAMFLMHDHNVVGRGDARTQTRFATVFLRAGLMAPDDAITFIPYWDNRGAVRSLTPGGYVNAYIKTKEKRTILTLASLQLDAAPIAMTVELNRAKLALADGPLTMTDLYTGEIFTITGNAVTVPIRKNDFRVLEVKN